MYTMDSFFVAVVDCGTLNALANGQVSHTGRTTFGQTAVYSCDTGYILVGGRTRTCQADGVWSGSEPTCEGVLLLSTSKWRERAVWLKCSVKCTQTPCSTCSPVSSDSNTLAIQCTSCIKVSINCFEARGMRTRANCLRKQ